MRSSILEVRNLTMQFGGLTAINSVDFDIPAGSCFGVIGPNGAGKTTLFNVVSGMIRPTSGSILFNALELNGLSTFERTTLGMARTFQNIRMFNDMTVVENVATGAHLGLSYNLIECITRSKRFKVSEARALQHALELLALVGLDKVAYERAGSLSYGDQKRLEIARALASKPKLLLLDEPAAGMNASETHTMLLLLETLKAEGLTLLLVEHDMPFVMRLCDHIMVLNYGRKIAEGGPSEIRGNAAVIEAYLGADFEASSEA